MIIAVTILAINATRATIITTLEDLVVILAEVTSEVVILAEVASEVVITITEVVVTVEVDTQIAIHALAHIRVLVEDLVTNATIVTLVDGGEMVLVTAPILEKQSPLQIMVVLLILVMPKFLFF